MFSVAKKHTPADRAAIDAFFASGGQVTVLPSRRAHQRNDGGWGRLNDESRRELGRAHD